MFMGDIMKTFNLNKVIKVKLTEKGLKILEADYYFNRPKDSLKEFIPPEVDENGYSSFQAWTFMQIFGNHFNNNAFFMDIIIEDKDLHELSEENTNYKKR